MLKEFRMRLRLRRLQKRHQYLRDALVQTKSRFSGNPLGIALNETEIEHLEDKLKKVEDELFRLQPRLTRKEH